MGQGGKVWKGISVWSTGDGGSRTSVASAGADLWMRLGDGFGGVRE